MGGNPSILEPRLLSNTISLSSYIDVLENINVEKTIQESRFLKSLQCTNEDGESLLVKVFIKPDSLIGEPATSENTTLRNQILDLQYWLEILDKQRSALFEIPGVVPFSKFIETERAAYLIRQYLHNNLYDRLNTRPFLDNIEKLWITYQLLVVLKDCHSKNVYHGDIKTENILVSSWNSVFLTDFGCYKPIYLPEDNPGEFVFYFDTSQRRNCYLAPERFLSSNQDTASNKLDIQNLSEIEKLRLEKMDIFSLGCVLAELYLEGGSIFTLSQLFKYKNNSYFPDLHNIDNDSLKSLIRGMISLDPDNRRTAKEYLEEYKNILFPSQFYDFLNGYVRELVGFGNNEAEISKKIERDTSLLSEEDFVNENFKQCDHRIERLYNDFDIICKELGFSYIYYDEDHLEASINMKRKLDEVPIFPLSFNLPGIPKDYIMKSIKNNDNNLQDKNMEIAILLLNIVISSVRNTYIASSRLKGIELMIALSEKISDESKLDRVVPFLISLLNDESADVRITALKALIQELTMIDLITPINALIFPEYILPKLRSYLTKDYCSSYEKMFFAVLLPNLALNAIRFYDMGQLLKSTTIPDIETILDDNGEIENRQDSSDVPKKSLLEMIELFTLISLTGDESTKIGFLSDIHILCSVIGKEKTNDIVLSHLITYLNDRNSYLRLAFVESIIGISMYVGSLSIEQYILPLLIQSLSDTEEFIILQVLKNFTHLVNLGLINKKTIWELTEMVSKLLLHPNEWIRQNSLVFILTVSDSLSLADVFCTLYPFIRPYLEYDLTEFNWNSLYPCIKKPLTRQIYNQAFIWYQRATSSTFWGIKKINKITGSPNPNNENNQGPASISKSISGLISKVATIPKRKNTENVEDGKANMKLDSPIKTTNGKSSHILLTNEDKLWVKKLKTLGLQESDLWKVYDLREHISKSSRSQTINVAGLNIKTTAQQLEILPRNVFLDIVFKPTSDKNQHTAIDIIRRDIEVVATSKKKETIINLSPNPSKKLDSESIFSGFSQNNSLYNLNNLPTQNPQSLLVSFKKASPSLLTNQENIYGELENINNSNLSSSSLPLNNGFKSISSLSSVVPVKVHSYTGNNENILRFLETYNLPPTLDHFHEFGPVITLPVGEKAFDMNETTWPPKGTLVAHLLEHKGAINCLSTSPDYSYFISGGEDGFIKIWDSSRLERNVTSESIISLNLNSSVNCICFIENRDCFAVATRDSSIKIYTVSLLNSNRSLKSRYKVKRLVQIRSFSFDNKDEFVTFMEYRNVDNLPLLIVITSYSRIVGIDVRFMNIEFILQNPLNYGISTTFCIDRKNDWILIGSNKGYLSLFDLRFKLLLKSWRFTGGKSIKRLSSAFNTSKHSFFTLLSDNNGLSIYDIQKGKIQEIYNATNGYRKSTSGTNEKSPATLIEVTEDDESFNFHHGRNSPTPDIDVNDDDFEEEEEAGEIKKSFSNILNNESDFSFDEIDQIIEPEKFKNIDNNDTIESSIDETVISEHLMTSFIELKIPPNRSNKKQLFLFSSDFNKNQIWFWDIFHSNNSKVITKKVKETSKKKSRTSLISNEQKTNIRNHHCLITDMTLLSKPYFMIVSGDKQGVINVYK